MWLRIGRIRSSQISSPTLGGPEETCHLQARSEYPDRVIAHPFRMTVSGSTARSINVVCSTSA